MNEETRDLALSNGGVALVDASRYEALSKYKWRLSTFGYVVCNTGPRKAQVTLRIHRLVMNAPSGMEVDHINGDKLDNREVNLRICTRQENGKNVKAKDGLYKGTYRSRGGWAAAIKSGKTREFLGQFTTRQEAALAYNVAAKRLHGEFARLNVIPNIPEDY